MKIDHEQLERRFRSFSTRELERELHRDVTLPRGFRETFTVVRAHGESILRAFRYAVVAGIARLDIKRSHEIYCKVLQYEIDRRRQAAIDQFNQEDE